MPSPPISPTSLSPSSKMASLASILHRGSSATGGPTTTRSTSSKSTPAPISTSSPMGAQQHQHTSPPPGAGASFPPPGLTALVHPLSPTTVETAAHVAVQDLPFYHQLEQVQRVREGKFQTSSTGVAAAAAPLESYYQTDAGVGGDETSSKSLTPTGTGPVGKVFERQIEEVEEAKEVLRKAGVVVGAAAGQQGQWGQQQDFQVKVQVQGDGHAKMRIMGAAEEADRDEGVRV